MRLVFFILLSIPFLVKGQGISDLEIQLQEAFLTVESGDTVRIPSGEHKILRTLWMDDVSNVIIRGAGMDESVLDFSDQLDGAEGIKVTNARNITLIDFTVRDASGDGIKVQDTEDVRFENIRAEWTGKPDKKNGAYGIYPVLCKKVNIYNSEASGASDAGIYVGQSEDIVVSRCLVWNNVAGIEIENSERADVFNNNAFGNTGGILVFDLPDLEKKKGGKIRVFNNIIAENNLKNFAPKGNIVGKVPQGTGVLILGTKGVEVFDNEILNNKSLGLGIISYYLTELPINDSQYDPYPGDISIHDNTFSRLKGRTTRQGRFGKLLRYKLRFGKDVPHIMWDGITENGENRNICIAENKNASFVNIDAENDFDNISRDLKPHSCSGTTVKPVDLR